jgi:hypothetical protein
LKQRCWPQDDDARRIVRKPEGTEKALLVRVRMQHATRSESCVAAAVARISGCTHIIANSWQETRLRGASAGCAGFKV